nr:MAG TPA: hypothetical protein [Caudoviricetes sp.]
MSFSATGNLFFGLLQLFQVVFCRFLFVSCFCERRRFFQAR